MKHRRILALLIATLIGVVHADGHAMGSKQPPATKSATEVKDASIGQSYLWYDGDRARTVWIDTQAVVEFAAGGDGALAELYPQTKSRALSQAVRLWEIPGGLEAIGKIKSAKPNAAVSPLFHDNASASGRMRALPGNVIVYLDPRWDRNQATAWARTNKVEILKKLEFGTNIYLIKTDAGLAALETANKLRQTQGVIGTTPDWWQEATTR